MIGLAIVLFLPDGVIDRLAVWLLSRARPQLTVIDGGLASDA